MIEFTHHAREKLRERRITVEEIEETLNDPEFRYFDVKTETSLL
ncbi:DUF4258 domain-containing protein [Archaeoglobus veneficus]